jgi:hypothetical protein
MSHENITKSRKNRILKGFLRLFLTTSAIFIKKRAQYQRGAFRYATQLDYLPNFISHLTSRTTFPLTRPLSTKSWASAICARGRRTAIL